MPDTAIEIDRLCKSYIIGHARNRGGYTALRDVVVENVKAFCRSAVSVASGKGWGGGEDSEEFWALEDVSLRFEVGEVVGIIGRNGAGKSTLLKILSRITQPTKGRVTLRGRVASLLEVGTGFHPELTGRENIFLNGSILGMSRTEIKARFDEIVAFSEVERFLDTPVKRYSSGMYVRLAFAVAAHLEPEILIVDEVLAVGDGDFQKKCLGKMKSMHGQGRTVIVVSHQMSTIAALCDRAVVMKSGRVDFLGKASDAVLHYQSLSSNGGTGPAMFDASLLNRKIGDEYAQLHRAWTENESGQIERTFDLGSAIVVKMEYSIAKKASRETYPNFHFIDERGECVFYSSPLGSQLDDRTNSIGTFVAECVIPPNLLNTGSYSIGLALTVMDPGVIVSFFERDALTLQITENFEVTLDSSRHGYAGVLPGVVRPRLDWKIQKGQRLISMSQETAP